MAELRERHAKAVEEKAKVEAEMKAEKKAQAREEKKAREEKAEAEKAEKREAEEKKKDREAELKKSLRSERVLQQLSAKALMQNRDVEDSKRKKVDLSNGLMMQMLLRDELQKRGIDFNRRGPMTDENDELEENKENMDPDYE